MNLNGISVQQLTVTTLKKGNSWKSGWRSLAERSKQVYIFAELSQYGSSINGVCVFFLGVDYYLHSATITLRYFGVDMLC